MKLFPCPFCAAKDETIARLDKRVEDLEKTLLAMMDPRAYALRYPKRPRIEIPPGNEPAPDLRAFGLATPAQLRAQPPYESPLTQEQLEAAFEEIR
jgi:hypothetical protein